LTQPACRCLTPDKTVTPNAAGEGINKSYAEQVGAGRGDQMTPGSSAYIIPATPSARHRIKAVTGDERQERLAPSCRPSPVTRHRLLSFFSASTFPAFKLT